MQCDWITANFAPSVTILDDGSALDLGYETGKTYRCQPTKLDPDGDLITFFSNWLQLPSHDTALSLKSENGADLWLSGNPVKFFQGHNLVGSTDAVGLFYDAGQALRQRLGMFPSPETALAWKFTEPRFTRLDLTRSYRFNSDEEARAWLRDVAGQSRSRHGSALMRGTSCYWGKASEYWTMVAYLKSDELKARKKSHHLSSELSKEARETLTDWSTGVVRFELRLKRLFLQKPFASLWALRDPLGLWESLFKLITFNRNMEAMESDMLEKQLKPMAAGYLARWRCGEDLRATLSKTTFYRVRADLMAAVGVDIASKPEKRSSPIYTPSTALESARWDPEPITEFLYVPSDAKDRYKVKQRPLL